MKRRNCFAVRGDVIASIAINLFCMGWTPSRVSQNPRYSKPIEKKLHFFALIFNPVREIRFRTSRSCLR